MRNFGPQFFLFLLVLTAAITLACGSSMSHVSSNCSTSNAGSSGGVPDSISLCPAVANANSFPDGQVQFIATAYYGTPPSPVTTKPQVWGACYQNAPTTAVSVSATGLAHCAAGSSGTYTVFASDVTTCTAIGPCGAGCQVTGSAQLTCP